MEMETAMINAMEVPALSSSTLGIRKESHGITKAKPKIRIIHIFAPEIIKTDAANFRELVQRLTGKPVERRGGKKKKRVARYEPRAAESSPAATVDHPSSELSGSRAVKKEEAEMWGCVNWSLIGEFAEMEDGLSTHDQLGEFSF